MGMRGQIKPASKPNTPFRSMARTPTTISVTRIRKPRTRETIFPPSACNFTFSDALRVSIISWRNGANKVLSRSPIEKKLAILPVRTTKSCSSAQTQPREYHQPTRSTNNISLLYHLKLLSTRCKSWYTIRYLFKT